MVRLTIRSEKGAFFDQEVDYVLLPTERGPLQFQEGCTPSIVRCVEAGVLKVVIQDKPNFFAIFHGLADVRPDGVHLLVEEVEDGYEIDMARAIARRDRALDIIHNANDSEDVQFARISLA
ncbi:MAG: hypothetical protein II520_04020, partial [Bacilli bacterium]|nr:hypothetical protein [Bacilli bacterium]